MGQNDEIGKASAKRVQLSLRLRKARDFKGQCSSSVKSVEQFFKRQSQKFVMAFHMRLLSIVDWTIIGFLLPSRNVCRFVQNKTNKKRHYERQCSCNKHLHTSTDARMEMTIEAKHGNRNARTNSLWKKNSFIVQSWKKKSDLYVNQSRPVHEVLVNGRATKPNILPAATNLPQNCSHIIVWEQSNRLKSTPSPLLWAIILCLHSP